MNQCGWPSLHRNKHKTVLNSKFRQQRLQFEIQPNHHHPNPFGNLTRKHSIPNLCDTYCAVAAIQANQRHHDHRSALAQYLRRWNHRNIKPSILMAEIVLHIPTTTTTTSTTAAVVGELSVARIARANSAHRFFARHIEVRSISV